MEHPITFETMPNALAYLIEKVESLEKLVLEQNPAQAEDEDIWFNLDELRAYLPDRPARQTVYGWIGRRGIPFHKKGKKLQFLKSEIDAWLRTDKHRTHAELMAEAEAYVNSTKKGGLK